MDCIYGTASCRCYFTIRPFASQAGQIVVQMRKPLISLLYELLAQMVFDLCRPFSIHGFVFRVYYLQALVCFIHRGALWGMGLTVKSSKKTTNGV